MCALDSVDDAMLLEAAYSIAVFGAVAGEVEAEYARDVEAAARSGKPLPRNPLEHLTCPPLPPSPPQQGGPSRPASGVSALAEARDGECSSASPPLPPDSPPPLPTDPQPSSPADNPEALGIPVMTAAIQGEVPDEFDFSKDAWRKRVPNAVWGGNGAVYAPWACRFPSISLLTSGQKDLLHESHAEIVQVINPVASSVSYTDMAGFLWSATCQILTPHAP